MAAELPSEDRTPDVQQYIQQWEPVITAIATTGWTGQPPSPELTEFLDEQAEQEAWAVLTAVLRRILVGERDESAPLADLDEIDTAVVRETLSRIAREEQPETG
jgi:hypothetical protein